MHVCMYVCSLIPKHVLYHSSQKKIFPNLHARVYQKYEKDLRKKGKNWKKTILFIYFAHKFPGIVLYIFFNTKQLLSG